MKTITFLPQNFLKSQAMKVCGCCETQPAPAGSAGTRKLSFISGLMCHPGFTDITKGVLNSVHACLFVCVCDLAIFLVRKQEGGSLTKLCGYTALPSTEKMAWNSTAGLSTH